MKPIQSAWATLAFCIFVGTLGCSNEPTQVMPPVDPLHNSSQVESVQFTPPVEPNGIEDPGPQIETPSAPESFERFAGGFMHRAGSPIKLVQQELAGILPSLEVLHQNYVQEFIQAPGFGIERIPRMRTFPSQLAKHEGQLLRLDEVRLVGLQLEDEPRVYLVGAPFVMRDSWSWPSRELDEFEGKSLKQIRAGRDFAYLQEASQARLFAGIYAEQDCLKCHGGSIGDLLGAFVYDFKAPSKPTQLDIAYNLD